MNMITFDRPRRSLLAVALSVSVMAGGVATQVAAQDGTDAATPAVAAIQCAIVPAGSMATPSASTAATPVASPIADDALTEDLTSAAGMVIDCLSGADHETLVQVTGDEYRGQLLGMDEPLSDDDFLELAAMLPTLPYELIDVRDGNASGENEATAVVEYRVAHQLRVSTWTFERADVDGEQVWTLVSEEPMAVDAPSNAAAVDVTANDDGYTLDENEVEGDSVVLNVTNEGDEIHEVLVLKLENGTTTDDVLRSTDALPTGAVYIGQVTVPAGGEGELVLVDLEPGTYTIVDLLPSADGTPNLQNGMEATLEVAE